MSEGDFDTQTREFDAAQERFLRGIKDVLAPQDSFIQAASRGTDRMNEYAPIAEGPTLMSWADLITKPKDVRPWMVTGLVRPGWLVALLGHGKEGKTTLALHLQACLAAGSPWVNRCIPQPCPTIYLSFEMAEDDLAGLVEPIQRGRTFQCPPQVVCDWVPPFKPLDLGPFLTGQSIPGLLVLDSFRGAFSLGRDGEKDAGVTGALLRTLQRVARRTGWTIVVIHHMRKSGTGDFLDGAGTGDWLAAPDAIWTWTRPHGQESGILRVTGRMPPVPDMGIRLSPTVCEYYGPATPIEAGFSDDAILHYVPDDPQGLSVDAIRKAWGDGAPAANTLLGRLNDLAISGPGQRVERFGAGTKGKPFHFRKLKYSFNQSESLESDRMKESLEASEEVVDLC